jgi:hypothetical protein
MKSLQGKRIQLIQTQDGTPVSEPKLGVVLGQDRDGNLLVKWDGNSTPSFLSKKSKTKITNEI